MTKNSYSTTAEIMLVDDMVSNLELLTAMLDKQGYVVRSINNGKDAIQSAINKAPDIILLDVMMPEMDGFEVCRQLKAIDHLKEVPIVFISAIHDVSEKLKAFEAGGIDYITKPFKVREVLARVETQLTVLWHQREVERLRERDKDLIERLSSEVKQRERAEQAAQAANQTKSKFFATMSHELRTPLNTILGFAQLMAADSSLSEDHHTSLKAILRSGEHLLGFINDVLEISRIEAGRVNFNPSNFDMHDLLKGLEEMMRPKAEEKGLLLTFELGENIPYLIHTDESKLRQVILNLLSNAIKFTSQGGISVKVDYLADPARTVPEEVRNAMGVGQLQIEVRDTGYGIAPEEFDELFEPFVQTQSGQYSKQGSGLGLAISREFVRMMGGEIHAQSDLGQGTTFSFDVQVVEIGKPISTKTPTNSHIYLAPGQPDYRVLIVEKHPEERDLLSKLMVSVGFKVKTAENCVDGIKVSASWLPHFIWVDIDKLTEQEEGFIQHLKAQPDPPVVVAISATVTQSQRELVLNAGFSDLITKPYHRIAIFECMTRTLEVKFNYFSSEPTSLPPPRRLEPNMLKSIPAELIERLRYQSTLLDAEAVGKIIREIQPFNPALASNLMQLVESFQFDRILTLIDNWHKGAKSRDG